MLYDKDIRPPLFDLLEENAGFFGGRVRILEEVTTGRARADAVMVTPGLLYGIEIKSDADTYARLDGQVKNYDWYYDRNIIVVGTSHAQHVMEHVPGWWGIITVEEVDGAADLYVLRRTQPNPKVKDHRKMTILWRPELARILEKNHMPRYRQKSKKYVQEKLLERVPGDILWPQVCEELFERDYNTIGQEIEQYKRGHRGMSYYI